MKQLIGLFVAQIWFARRAAPARPRPDHAAGAHRFRSVPAPGFLKKCDQHLRFGFRIRGGDQPCAWASRIADSKYLALRSRILCTCSTDGPILRADLRPSCTIGTAEDRATLAVPFRLPSVNVLKIVAADAQGRNEAEKISSIRAFLRCQSASNAATASSDLDSKK